MTQILCNICIYYGIFHICIAWGMDLSYFLNFFSFLSAEIKLTRSLYRVVSFQRIRSWLYIDTGKERTLSFFLSTSQPSPLFLVMKNIERYVRLRACKITEYNGVLSSQKTCERKSCCQLHKS